MQVASCWSSRVKPGSRCNCQALPEPLGGEIYATCSSQWRSYTFYGDVFCFSDLTWSALCSRGRVQEQGDWACSALKASTATACAGCYPRIGACRISFACFGRRLWRTSIKRLGGVQWYLLMQDFSRRATRVASLHKVAWRSTGHLAGGEGKPPDPLHLFDILPW